MAAVSLEPRILGLCFLSPKPRPKAVNLDHAARTEVHIHQPSTGKV